MRSNYRIAILPLFYLFSFQVLADPVYQKFDFAEKLHAAEGGDGMAQFLVGNAYHAGKSTVTGDPTVIPKNDAEAVKWWKMASEQESGFQDGAQNALGNAYHNGWGVPKDDAEAVKWWKKAAELGNIFSQNSIGFAYHSGEGVPKDDAEAVRWWKMAAVGGFGWAQANLGAAYRNGAGVPKDYVQAYMWLTLAVNQVWIAKKSREELVTSMTPEQIAEGERLVKEWKPQQSRVRPPVALKLEQQYVH
jgi:TPR repeat protein